MPETLPSSIAGGCGSDAPETQVELEIPPPTLMSPVWDPIGMHSIAQLIFATWLIPALDVAEAASSVERALHQPTRSCTLGGVCPDVSVALAIGPGVVRQNDEVEGGPLPRGAEHRAVHALVVMSVEAFFGGVRRAAFDNCEYSDNEDGTFTVECLWS